MGDASASTPLVVRTSQSGIIPDTPGPLPEISGLIPDNADIDPAFQVRKESGTIYIGSFYNILKAWLSGSHNRTTKSGILVENPISRIDFPTSPEAVTKDITLENENSKDGNSFGDEND